MINETTKTEVLYMNPETGSVDTLDGWYPNTPESNGLVEVTWCERCQTWHDEPCLEVAQ